MKTLKRAKNDFYFVGCEKDEYCLAFPNGNDLKIGERVNICLNWYDDSKPIECVVTFASKYTVYVKEKRR